MCSKQIKKTETSLGILLYLSLNSSARLLDYILRLCRRRGVVSGGDQEVDEENDEQDADSRENKSCKM